MIGEDPRLAQLERRTQNVTALMVIVMLILLLQLWLLTIALEGYLAANMTMAVPTFLASGFCLLINLGLLRSLYRIDEKHEE